MGVLRRAALGVALLLPLLFVPGAASAADTQPVQILIEGVAPAIPTQKDTLRVTGRVANTSDTDIALPRVQLRLSPLQLNSRGEVTAVLDGTTDRTGTPFPDTLTDLGTVLAPGQQAQFRLSVPIADMALDPDLAGVYAVFVEVLSGELPLLESGTVFPWFPPDAELEPSRAALVWPIVQTPAIAADELVVDPTLPGEFADAGRLGRLLDIGSRYPVSWLVDTATWQAARSMSDGYRVQAPGGPQPGDQTDAAAQFAERLQQVVTSEPTQTIQFAFADADALQRAGMTQFVTRAASLPQVLTEQYAPSARATRVFDAPGGNADYPALETLVDTGIRDLLLSDRYFPPEPPLAYTPSGVTPVSVDATEATGLLADQVLDRTLARPLDTASDRSRAKQDFLAQTALVTLELPTEPRDIVIQPPTLWDPPRGWLNRLLKASAKAPWLELVNLTQVAEAQPVPRAAVGYTDLNQRRELPTDYVQRIRSLDDELSRLSRIVVDPTGYGETFSIALQRATSALWRPEDSQRSEFLDTVAGQIQEQKQKVRVVSTGTVTLAGESGVVPLTIANDLDQTVSVGVQLVADNPVALQSTALEPVRIDAREKAGVEIPVRVVSSQPMTVTIVLTDDEGMPYDDSGRIELRSTASSRIATIVAVVGGVALVILVSLNLLRRRRRDDPDPVPDDAPKDDTHV